jgi:phospholipase/carboxylesterase
MIRTALLVFGLVALLILPCFAQDMQLKEDLSLKYLVQLPAENAKNAPVIILLHGRGSNEADMFSMRGKFPQNYIVVSVRAPYGTREGFYDWFDMGVADSKPQINAQNVENSRNLLARFITEVVTKYNADPKQVYMMGFSQGAIMSYEVGLTSPEKLSGIGVLSGMLLSTLKPLIKMTPALSRLKVFIGHGTADERLSFDLATANNAYLKGLGLNPEFHAYRDMKHHISSEELDDLVKWLGK